MNKIFRLSATLVGMLSLVTGFTACSKDDDKGGKCCTLSYTYDDVTYNIAVCEDGTAVFSDSTGESYTYNWKTDEDSELAGKTWDEVKAYVISMKGTCN